MHLDQNYNYNLNGVFFRGLKLERYLNAVVSNSGTLQKDICFATV